MEKYVTFREAAEENGVSIDTIRRNAKKLLNEVYEGDIEGFIKRGNQFFSLMPNSNYEVEFSEHSPLSEDKKA